jgi:pyruvate dehydrogenase E1 component alpha subunit
MTQTSTDMLRAMKLIRAFETTLAAHKDHGFQLLSSGEEAVAVGLCSALRPEDQLLTGGRSIGPALARGVEPCRLMAELLGKATGTNRGKGGRGHLSDPANGFFGAHAVVGGNLTIAAGVALARQQMNEPGIVVVLFGDGASGAGALHETLNIANLWRLPLLFVCNNNQLSVSTERSAALAPQKLSDFAKPYAMPTGTVDGMDLPTVLHAIDRAVAHVRSGAGPAFVECVSYRFLSHSTNARETRGAAELAEIRARCPIVSYAGGLKAQGGFSDADEAAMDQEVSEVVGAAMRFALESPYPETSEALTDVY